MAVGVKFTVPGEAATAGSKRAIIAHGRAVVVDSARAKGKPWRLDVQAIASEAMNGALPFTGPLTLVVRIDRVRPRVHYTPTGALNATGRRNPYPITRPDLLKHIRALEDALTGVVWRDDSQVVDQHLEKRWGPVAQTTVAVWIKTDD